MKVKVKRATIIDGKAAQSGEIVDISEKDAPFMFRTGRAERVEEVATEPVAEITDEEVEVEQPENPETANDQPSNGLPQQLTDVEGIGPLTAAKLIEAGINTVADLIAADADILAEQMTGVTATTIRKWQEACQ